MCIRKLYVKRALLIVQKNLTVEVQPSSEKYLRESVYNLKKKNVYVLRIISCKLLFGKHNIDTSTMN